MHIVTKMLYRNPDKLNDIYKVNDYIIFYCGPVRTVELMP